MSDIFRGMMIKKERIDTDGKGTMRLRYVAYLNGKRISDKGHMEDWDAVIEFMKHTGRYELYKKRNTAR